MSNKLVLVLCLVSSLVQAAPSTTVQKKNFDIPKLGTTDLMEETTSLKLNTEASVQTQAVRSDLYFNLIGGIMRPKSLAMTNGDIHNTYDFSQFSALPLVTAQFGYYPWAFRWGKLGAHFSAGYSYSEYKQTYATALHMFPVEAAVAYRGEFSSTQKIVPFVSVGPQGYVVFQRGLEQLNNSQFYKAVAASAGVTVNLSRLGLYHSRTEAEMVLQYKRSFAESSLSSDFNTNTYQLGGALSL